MTAMTSSTSSAKVLNGKTTPAIKNINVAKQLARSIVFIGLSPEFFTHSS
jgi:hypothetical protein